MKQRALTGVLSLFILLFCAGNVLAAEIKYDFTLTGVSKTISGQSFNFTATGTMTWNDVSGHLSFEVTTSAGVSFAGEGILAAGSAGSFALTTFDSGFASGEAVFSGKFSKGNSKFSGKFYAASPDRLGPAPGGFVFTSGTVKATQQ